VHNLQRCGLLLLMFCGLCVCICLSVTVCVGHNCEPYKNGLNDQDAVRSVDSGVPKEPCIRWGPGSPSGRGSFRGAPCSVAFL